MFFQHEVQNGERLFRTLLLYHSNLQHVIHGLTKSNGAILGDIITSKFKREPSEPKPRPKVVQVLNLEPHSRNIRNIKRSLDRPGTASRPTRDSDPESNRMTSPELQPNPQHKTQSRW